MSGAHEPDKAGWTVQQSNLGYGSVPYQRKTTRRSSPRADDFAISERELRAAGLEELHQEQEGK